MNDNTPKTNGAGTRRLAIVLGMAAVGAVAAASLLAPSTAQAGAAGGSSALSITPAAPAAAPDAADDRLGRLAGQWRMSALEIRTANGFERVQYSGQIIFTPAGTMAVQAMNPDLEAPDTAYTVDGYEAFYGRVRVNREAGRFVVRVRSAAARDLIGQRLRRNFEVSGDTLVLTPVDPAEGWRVTYERMS